jgi:hypothetical protein
MYVLSATSVDVYNNDAINIDGRHSTGAGYSTTAKNTATFIQTNQVTGHVEIAWNRITNIFGQSAPEDVISLFKTIGSSGDPAEVHHNLINGAYPMTLTTGFSGSGIMLDEDTSWAYIHDNVVVNTINCGIGSTGEHDNLVTNNRIVGSSRDEFGNLFTAANVGMYVWNSYSDPGWANNSSPNNAAAFHRYNGGVGDRNDWWTPDCTDCTGNVHEFGGATVVTKAHEAAEVDTWEASRTAAGQWIGPR